MTKVRRAIGGTFFAVAVGTLLVVFDRVVNPSQETVWLELINLVHILVFAVVAAGMLGLVSSLFGKRVERRTLYLLAFSWTLVLGGVSELIQVFGERNSSLLDYLRNLDGAAVALLILAGFDRRLGNRGPDAPAGRRWRMLGLAALLLVLSLVPVAVLGEAYRQRSAKFPVLCAFDSVFELRLIKPRAASIRIVRAPEGWEEFRFRRVGKLSFYPSRYYYPGVRWFEPPSHWSAYRYLELDLFLDSDRDGFIVLRIDDRAAHVDRGDWFTRRFPLRPGANRLRVPLSEVRHAPKSREMDLDAIERVFLFSVQPARPVHIYVADLRLTGNGLSRDGAASALVESAP